MPRSSSSWLSRRLLAFVDAARGLAYLITHEPPVWLHLLATLLTLGLSAYLRLTPVEWAIIVLTIAAVWAAEAFNTAIEILCDTIHPDHHPQIGRVKDLAAAGVLFTAIAALAVAGVIFGPRLYGLF